MKRIEMDEPESRTDTRPTAEMSSLGQGKQELATKHSDRKASVPPDAGPAILEETTLDGVHDDNH
jgi:hypothetical protein